KVFDRIHRLDATQDEIIAQLVKVGGRDNAELVDDEYKKILHHNLRYFIKANGLYNEIMDWIEKHRVEVDAAKDKAESQEWPIVLRDVSDWEKRQMYLCCLLAVQECLGGVYTTEVAKQEKDKDKTASDKSPKDRQEGIDVLLKNIVQGVEGRKIKCFKRVDSAEPWIGQDIQKAVIEVFLQGDFARIGNIFDASKMSRFFMRSFDRLCFESMHKCRQEVSAILKLLQSWNVPTKDEDKQYASQWVYWSILACVQKNWRDEKILRDGCASEAIYQKMQTLSIFYLCHNLRDNRQYGGGELDEFAMEWLITYNKQYGLQGLMDAFKNGLTELQFAYREKNWKECIELYSDIFENSTIQNLQKSKEVEDVSHLQILGNERSALIKKYFAQNNFFVELEGDLSGWDDPKMKITKSAIDLAEQYAQEEWGQYLQNLKEKYKDDAGMQEQIDFRVAYAKGELFLNPNTSRWEKRLHNKKLSYNF
ncbi:MAG: hypothetical protein FWD76_06520, partial [Firmicutes bacterium]|nr:hypothetical protein [Bacillota bacterium]